MSARIAVLISGTGSNLAALIADEAPIAVVVSNRPRAGGLDKARAAGIPAEVLRHRAFPTREAYDAAMVELLRGYDVDWIVLAGFMRIVTATLLDAFENRVINVHPSLLPAYPGMHGAQQAIDGGSRITGCTVHLVDTGTDTGPIIAQGAVPVLDSDDASTLQARIQRVEHTLLPQVVRWARDGRIAVVDGRVRVELPDGEQRFMLAAG